MKAVTHLEKVIAGETPAVTHLEKVIAQETSAVTYTEKVITGEAAPVTHLQKVIAGEARPVTHLEYVWAGGSPPSVQEYTGAVPVTFVAGGTPLLDYLISGNTVQSATPTPDNPIMPEGTGERTGNLFDYNAYFNSVFTPYNEFFNYAEIQLQPNTTYTLSTSIKEIGSNPRSTAFIVATSNETPTTASGGISNVSPITKTTESDGILKLYKRITGIGVIPTKGLFDAGEWLMLNSGSTALPYEPYGYKIPISSAGQTTPIYLGEVETTRRVKKFVFDGTEKWQAYGSVSNTYRLSISNTQSIGNPAICSHFVNSPISSITSGKFTVGSTWIYIRYADVVDLADFKSYLAAQYAAGTPVTVWYVLATPETAVVNEPLMKIGDYADSISKEQAGVEIPTVSGSTTLDVETTVKPSEVYIKYRGEAVGTLSALSAEVSSPEEVTEEENPEEMEEMENGSEDISLQHKPKAIE